jgi:hypothetical protein
MREECRSRAKTGIQIPQVPKFAVPKSAFTENACGVTAAEAKELLGK